MARPFVPHLAEGKAEGVSSQGGSEQAARQQGRSQPERLAPAAGQQHCARNQEQEVPAAVDPGGQCAGSNPAEVVAGPPGPQARSADAPEEADQEGRGDHEGAAQGEPLDQAPIHQEEGREGEYPGLPVADPEQACQEEKQQAEAHGDQDQSLGTPAGDSVEQAQEGMPPGTLVEQRLGSAHQELVPAPSRYRERRVPQGVVGWQVAVGEDPQAGSHEGQERHELE